tara:strand:+ start:1693 stop:3642 length:1950 start_codon:yes stop_codon:yes gene_type:complete
MENLLSDNEQFEIKVSEALSKNRTDLAIEICLEYLEKDIPRWKVYEKLGLICLMRSEWSQSLNYSQKALALNRNSVQSWSSLGIANKNLGKFNEALAAYKEAIKIKPESEVIFSNMGLVLWKLNRYDQAKQSFQKALQIRKIFPEATYNLGKVYESENNIDEAIFLFRNAIKMRSNYSNAILDLSICLDKKGNILEAINILQDHIEGNICSSLIIKNLITLKGKICDWSQPEKIDNYLKDVGIIGMPISPMGLMAYEDSPDKHLLRAKRYWQHNFNNVTPKVFKDKYKNQKLKIGYFSADFREHAVMHLFTRVLELHNTERFSIFCFSFGKHPLDRYTNRIINSVAEFIDVSEIDDESIAVKAREKRIDIAVDLMGYSYNSRPKIFSYRAAPVQISYLGFPASMGANSIDYLIADKYLIPEDNRKYYSEKIVYMPTCYQCNDDKLIPTPRNYSKNQIGLMNDEFVFSCFNTNYKITPKEFYIWTNLLKRINSSVLWLAKSNKFSEQNLRNFFEQQGINPRRIIFSEIIKIEDHLSRLKISDLHLDTFNYNAGATAVFSLKAGVPILTKSGRSYTARMATSILKSLGLDELVTSTESEYENVAYHFATNRDSLNKIKLKIKKLQNSDFFQSSHFTNELEAIYMKIHKGSL